MDNIEKEVEVTMIGGRPYLRRGDNAWVYSGDAGKVLDENAEAVYKVLREKYGIVREV